MWAQTPGAEQDTQAVRDVVARYVKARNDKDSDAVRRLFTTDADQLVSTGEWRRGIDKLVRGAMESSQRERSQSSIQVENVRFLDADVGIADGRYRTTSLSGATREMWTTLVLKRTGTEWRIAAIRNMLPAAPNGAGR